MKFTLRDLKKLQWHTLLAAALLLLAVALGFWSRHRLLQAQSERATAASHHQQIDERLRQVRTEEQEIKARTTLFQQLENSGMTGEEKRLEWIELLRELPQQLHLPGMNYEFGPQIPLDSVADAAYAYHSSRLRIQLRLVHEEDLLNFTQQLQQRAKAMVLLRSCHVSRVTDASSLAQLGADCDMDWVTLRRASGVKAP